MPNGLGSG